MWSLKISNERLQLQYGYQQNELPKRDTALSAIKGNGVPAAADEFITFSVNSNCQGVQCPPILSVAETDKRAAQGHLSVLLVSVTEASWRCVLFCQPQLYAIEGW